jgi:Chaperone of endosialidase
MKTKTLRKTFSTISVMFACAAMTQAVVPPPDGGYANRNTAEGDSALFSLTTGTDNTALGFQALYSNTTGSFNVATGRFALLTNNGDENTAVGASALKLNTTGSQNTALGRVALFNNTTGSFNNAFGYNALEENTTGYENTAIGDCGLMANTIGHDNQSLGEGALISNTSGDFNVAVGSFAVSSNTTGNLNIGLGFLAGAAGLNLTMGSNNIDIGNLGIAGESNTIRIGEEVTVPAVPPPGFPPVTLPAHTATYIAGISGTAITGTPVVVKSNGQLGVRPSSQRFKTEIKPMENASEAILALRPVTFRYKKEVDPDLIPRFGLVAEEVEKVNPALVAHDAQGKPYTVRYEAVNAMLLNEFLKEHRKVQEQEATIAQLKSGVNALVAHIKEQDSKIQKVSDQLELSKSASQVATIK